MRIACPKADNTMKGIIMLLVLNVYPAISAKCTDVEILQYFASSTLPWDYYRRISEAVYPPTKLPSLLINVRVVFVNESSPSINSTDVCSSGHEAGGLNYKWSMACLYVSGGVSLNTMTFFSLATIYPQRRETQLCLKLPKKCRSVVESEADMKYFLSKLQGIAARPTAPDTSKNTVKCVTVHHPENELHASCWSLFGEPLQDALCGVWIYILIASAVLSLCISLVLKYYLEHAASSEDVQKLEKERETAAKEANLLIGDAAKAAKAATKEAAVAPAVEERLIDWITSAWQEADKIVQDGVYRQLPAKAAETIIGKAAEEAAAAAAMAAAARETTLVALEHLRAQEKLASMTLTAKAKSLKNSIADAATIEIVNVVNDMRVHIAAGRIDCVMTAARQRGAEAALLEIAISTTGEKETKVLHKMAVAAANVAAAIAVGTAEAETLDLTTEATVAERSAEAKSYLAESEAKKAVAKVLNGIGARGDTAKVLESETGRSGTGAIADVVDVKDIVIEVAVAEVMDTVRQQVTQAATGTVASLITKKEPETRRGAAEAAVEAAKQEIEKRRCQKRETKMSEREVLQSIAETAAEAAAKVLIPATAEAAERTKAAIPLALTAVEEKQDEMKKAATRAAENAADDFVASSGKEENVAAAKAARWAAVAAEALAAKEVAAKAASAARKARDRAAEAATPRATMLMLWIFAVGECFLFLILVLIQIINCAKDSDWDVCKVDLGKDVGLWLYVFFFLFSFILPGIFYRVRKNVKYHNPGNTNDCDPFSIVIHPSVFSSIHHLMWICLGVITEPFWAFPVFIAIGSCLFVIYFIVHSFFATCQKVTWFPLLFSVGCILSFVVFMFAVMLVGRTLFSDSFISNIAQSFLVLVVTMLFRYLQPPGA